MNNENKVSPFEEIATDMQAFLSSFKEFLVNQALSFEPEIQQAAREAISIKGKYIRPLLVCCASTENAKQDSLIRRATIAELVHLSTLLHDDVIDNADMRRNQITTNRKYGAKTAILLGDAIFSHMMTLTFEENDMNALKKTANCVKTICEGEIKQTLSDQDEIVTKQKYYDIAYGKTAALFEFACFLGADASNTSEDWVVSVQQVGKELGIAYQIYDDICDWFMSEKDAGKTLGTDLISGKQTYPLIVLLEKLPNQQSAQLAKTLKTQSPDDVANLMINHNIAQDCKDEFMRRIINSEEILGKFPNENKNLLKFCSAMKKLKFG